MYTLSTCTNIPVVRTWGDHHLMLHGVESSMNVGVTYVSTFCGRGWLHSIAAGACQTMTDFVLSLDINNVVSCLSWQ